LKTAANPRLDPSFEPPRAPWDETEALTIGQLLLDNEVREQIDFLEAEDFTHPLLRQIWEVCGLLIPQGKRADPITLEPHFENYPPIERGLTAVQSIRKLVSAPAIHHGDVVERAHELRERTNRRRLIMMTEDAAELALNPSPDRPVDAQASELISKLETLTEGVTVERPSWSAPDFSLLDDRRGDLPDFPAEVLSAPTQRWLEKAAHGAGVRPDHVMVPLLSVASSLVGNARRIKASRGWSEPLAVWTAIVGHSGTGKTPGIEVTSRALSRVEKSRKSKIGELQRQHETKAVAAKAAEKKWKAEVAEAIEANRKPKEMPAQAMHPGEFIAPRLVVSDATIERLAVLNQARPAGLAMVCDELAGLFLNMARYSNGSDKEFWLKAWNGGHHSVERLGRAPTEVDQLLIGITGGFQPDKLVQSFEGADDGMYARVLFAWPQRAPYRELSDEVSEVEPEFQNALNWLADLADAGGGEFSPREMFLTRDARAEFEVFRRTLDEGLEALDGREREWWSKGATQVLRLSGTLCFLHWAMSGAGKPQEPKEVGPEDVRGAVTLWRTYFWPHARAALRQMGLSERHANARRVLRWVRANKKAEVSSEDLRRDALSQSLDAEQTQRLIDGLVQKGWLRLAKLKGKKGPGRRVTRWEVNPKLFL
jgi:hypothetical protein